MTAPIITTRGELDRALRGLDRPGFVPTMGALHAGHLDLIARSASENSKTVVSVFVNPAQFGNQADLERYPRGLEADATLASSAGATLIFAPPVGEIYPAGFETWVEPGLLARRWEGASRPGHFRGVCTVVAKLLNLVRPARSYFGEKDYQQLQVVRRMHADLALPGTITGCPTIREIDGLALSSRNARLDARARGQARSIPRALESVQEKARGGERSIERLVQVGRDEFERIGVDVDYLAIVDPESLDPMEVLDRTARVLVAVNIDGVRLIDNAAIQPAISPFNSVGNARESNSCR